MSPPPPTPPPPPDGRIRKITADTRIITPEFREWLRSSLDAMPRGAQRRLASLVGCSTGYIADIVTGRARSSGKLDAIERCAVELGATPLRADLAMLRHLIDALDDSQRDYVRTACDVLLSGGTAKQRQQLKALLRSFKK